METYNINDKVEPKLESETIMLFGKERVVYREYWHFLCKISQTNPVELSRDLFKQIPIGSYYMDDERQIYRKLTDTSYEKVVGYGLITGHLWQKGTLKYIGVDFKWIYDVSTGKTYMAPDYLESEELKAIAEKSKETGDKRKAEIREKIVNYLRLHQNATLEAVTKETDIPIGTVRSHMTDMGILVVPKCEYLRSLDIKEQKDTGEALNVKTTRNNSLIKLLIQFFTKILQKLI